MSDVPTCGCCSPPPPPTAEGVCPTCRNSGRPVQPATLRALLQPHLREQVWEEPYRFCGSTACQVVYFLPGTGQVFLREELTVRVGMKETIAPRPICYCFGHTVESLREEWLRTGTTGAVQEIQAAVKAGSCRCEVSNPHGGCCLGDVLKALKEIQDPACLPRSPGA